MVICSGYWPPEYVKHQIISKEFDIFSLGVIIVKIMTGHDGYSHVVEMTTRKSVMLVRISFLMLFPTSILENHYVIFHLMCIVSF